MSVEVVKLPGEPIVIATMIGDQTTRDLLVMYEQSMALVTDVSGPIYRITDTNRASIDFSELVELMSAMGEKRTGSTQDERIRPILVGTHPDASLIVNSMRQQQYGAVSMALFEDLDSAVAYAREQVAATH